MKSCATCVHINRRCDGECSSCGHRIEGAKADNPSVSYADTSLYTREALRRVSLTVEFGCKCLECYEEDSGKYKHWEEDKRITELLKNEEE